MVVFAVSILRSRESARSVKGLLDARRILFAASLLSLLGACAAPAPTPNTTQAGGGDALGSSPFSETAKSMVGNIAGANAVDRLYQFHQALIDNPKYFYSGTTKAEPYFPPDAEKSTLTTSNGQNLVRVIFYTGLRVDSKDPTAVADVLRLQTLYPSEYKSNGFTSDPDVTFTPSNIDTLKFAKTSYSYKKPAKDGDKSIDYEGGLEFFSFGGGGVVVGDNLVRNNSSMLTEYKGLLLIVPYKDFIAVVGRTEQVLAAEQQTITQVQDKLKTRVGAAIERDYQNYKRAADAKRIMDGKRAKSGGK